MTIPTPRDALTQLLARLDQTTDKDGPVPAWMDSYCTAVQALKAEPETPAEALAARPLLEQVARLGDCIGQQTVAQVRQLAERAAAWLRENPAGRPVAIEPRGCPMPGACSCVEPIPPAPAPGEVGEEEEGDDTLPPIYRAVNLPFERFMYLLQRDALHIRGNALAPIFAQSADRIDRAIALIRQQAAELAALRGVQVPTSQMPWEREKSCPTFLDAIRLAQGCHDYSGGHSGAHGEAFQDGVGTVVAVLKRAAVGPWDSQTMAVFAVGSAPQAGEGEA